MGENNALFSAFKVCLRQITSRTLRCRNMKTGNRSVMIRLLRTFVTFLQGVQLKEDCITMPDEQVKDFGEIQVTVMVSVRQRSRY